MNSRLLAELDLMSRTYEVKLAKVKKELDSLDIVLLTYERSARENEKALLIKIINDINSLKVFVKQEEIRVIEEEKLTDL